MENIPFQYEIRLPPPEIPNIYGASDYREFREVLVKVDHLLQNSDLERRFLDRALGQWLLSGGDHAVKLSDKQSECLSGKRM